MCNCKIVNEIIHYNWTKRILYLIFYIILRGLTFGLNVMLWVTDDFALIFPFGLSTMKGFPHSIEYIAAASLWGYRLEVNG